MDVHGMRAEEAYAAVDQQVQAAHAGIYRIRIIHGYKGGTRIRSKLREEYSYGREPKVKRVVMGDNEGITELVLREY